MIDVSKYEKIGEYRYGRMTWFFIDIKNIVYLIMFGEESYIGSSKNLRRRFSQYVPALIRGRYDAKKVQRAFNLNEGFCVYAIEFTNPEDLRGREEYYLNLLHPTLNTRTTVQQIYGVPKVECANRKERFIGVQTKITMSMYNRLVKLKELRGESICDMVAKAISEWLDMQNTNFIEYNHGVQTSSRGMAVFHHLGVNHAFPHTKN